MRNIHKKNIVNRLKIEKSLFASILLVFALLACDKLVETSLEEISLFKQNNAHFVANNGIGNLDSEEKSKAVDSDKIPSSKNHSFSAVFLMPTTSVGSNTRESHKNQNLFDIQNFDNNSLLLSKFSTTSSISSELGERFTLLGLKPSGTS